MGCFSATNLLRICEFPLFFEVLKTGKVKIIAKLNLKFNPTADRSSVGYCATDRGGELSAFQAKIQPSKTYPYRGQGPWRLPAIASSQS